MTRIAFHPVAAPLKTLSPANDTVQAGRYQATTLSAVDTDLAAANIKDGVVIFGKTGTYSQSLEDDTTDNAVTALVVDSSGDGWSERLTVGDSAAEQTIATVTTTFAAGSKTIAVAVVGAMSSQVDEHRAKLYMDGVNVASSTNYAQNVSETKVLVATRAMAGTDKICYVSVHGDHASGGYYIYMYGKNVAGEAGGGIGVGSLKVS